MKCGKDGHMAKDCKEKAIVRTIEHVVQKVAKVDNLMSLPLEDK